MNNERFFNAYVELLTSTLHDALNKNIVFQAQAKVSGEDQEELKNTINRLENSLEQYKNIENSISQKDTEINSKNAEIGKLKIEFEQAKSETAHLNTFRNELIAARQQIDNKENQIKEITKEYENRILELNSKIEYLQMTPSQRKKVDAKYKKQEIIADTTESKDGGSF